MQVFIVGTPYYTAKVLDSKRLNKQIIENKQIMDAILGTGKGWFNHPVVKSYKNHFQWLYYYNLCLFWYQRGCKDMAKKMSEQAMAFKPNFHIEEYLNQMKRRLYTKNNQYYSQWSDLGESDCNWYCSDDENKFLKYINGKRIE
jgi:hypothetical protein